MAARARPSPFAASLPARADAKAMDAADPLASARHLFSLPPGAIYLDGNSLGALPRATPARLQDVVRDEWGGDLIASWNKHGWIDLARRVGDKIAKLIGAEANTVSVGDSTSIALFKVLADALARNPGRKTILSERGNFPTDLYMAEGLAALLGQGHRLELVERVDDIGDDVAVVMLTHVDYRTGAMHDMAAITAKAHAAGARVIWDLAHSAGALPVDLAGAKADYAVGCGYKYLNGGPGAPAFLYVAPRHHEGFRQPLQGWLGHAAPFAFEPAYRPAAGIAGATTGTPPILSLAALEVGVDTLLRFPMVELRAKSEALTEIFRTLVQSRAAELGLECVSPAAPEARGSQISFCHEHAYAIVQALIAQGVTGDFRAPDILRFGFAPLYVRYVDAWDAAAHLVDTIESRRFDDEKFRRRQAVT
ncbi:MAG: kynureninase [Tagaea sp. CACIAM 22H2]|nr:kynureninase [Tagaea sp. CACIAM 22H2]